MAGATVFDTALGGIGAWPYVPQAAGNLPTEDVVFMLEDMGVSTGIDLEAIIRAAQLLDEDPWIYSSGSGYEKWPT